MVICIISREYPPGNRIGGIGTYSYLAAGLLAGKGHKVYVMTYAAQPSITLEEGVQVHRFPMLPHHFKPGRLGFWYRAAFRKFLPVYLDALTWARTAAAYWKSFHREKAIQAVEFPETMGEGALLEFSRDIHAVCRIHSSSLSFLLNNTLEKYLITRLQKKACARANLVVSPSRWVRDHYAPEILKLSAEKVKVSRNPPPHWDAPVNWESKSIHHIAFVGRVEHRKGLHLLLSILPELFRKHPELKVRVLGAQHPPRHPEDARVQASLKKKLEAFPNLEHLDGVSHDELWSHLDWAGLLIQPSLVENYPYVTLEALSRGCYVLCSDAGGLPEIMDRPSRGLLHHTGNEEMLKDQVEDCLSRAHVILKHLRRNVQCYLRDFTPETNPLEGSKSGAL